MASANMVKLQTAIDELNKCVRYVRLFESGEVTIAEGYTITLTAQQITQLKQSFATARTAGTAAWDAVTANGS